jgi:hypothetical protein
VGGYRIRPQVSVQTGRGISTPKWYIDPPSRDI